VIVFVGVEDCQVHRLQQVGQLRWQLDDDDLVFFAVRNEFERLVRSVAIKNKDAFGANHVVPGTSVEVLKSSIGDQVSREAALTWNEHCGVWHCVSGELRLRVEDSNLEYGHWRNDVPGRLTASVMVRKSRSL
jgi:hypothetical protein